jgi:hypothetical protein
LDKGLNHPFVRFAGGKKDMNEGTTECVCCREEIKKGAAKCTKCDTYQDWRRYISVSNITLSLIIALVANLTTLYQIYHSHVKMITIKAKDVDMKPEYLQVAFSNSGNTVAIIRGGSLWVKRNNKVEGPPLQLNLFSSDGKPIDPCIEPNKGKLLELQPYNSGGFTGLPPKSVNDSTCDYVVDIYVDGFNTKIEKYTFETDKCL